MTELPLPPCAAKTAPRRAFLLRTLLTVVLAPCLYVVSSGPAITYGWHGQTEFGVHYYFADDWWLNLYGPVFKLERQWGNPLRWYWSQFPILEVPPHAAIDLSCAPAAPAR